LSKNIVKTFFYSLLTLDSWSFHESLAPAGPNDPECLIGVLKGQQSIVPLGRRKEAGSVCLRVALEGRDLVDLTRYPAGSWDMTLSTDFTERKSTKKKDDGEYDFLC